MSDRTLSVDDLISEIDEHLSEIDTVYLCALAERLLGGSYEPLGDGETIRHDGCKRQYASVIGGILGRLHEMEPAQIADLATTFLTDTYEARPDGRIDVTFRGDEPTAPGLS
jgi:hypothetical protein